MGLALVRFVLWATTLRKQRFVLGALLLLLAHPTYAGYDFRGASLLSAMCLAGGVVGVGTALLFPHADHTDDRDVFLGVAVSLVFATRFVVFVYDDLQKVEDPLSLAAVRELYDGASAPIIHLMLLYVGMLIAARPFRAREERAGDASE